jgi:hypothetical protein
MVVGQTQVLAEFDDHATMKSGFNNLADANLGTGT